jgi:apolipoprotein D and lipocalin family protein
MLKQALSSLPIPSFIPRPFAATAIAAILLLLTACTGMPEKVTPVKNFELSSYLGRWYEIARLDHSFERGMSHVTAEYSLREDGGVNVLNQGYQTKDGVWEQAEGKAYFVQDPQTGHLKVSFFGPFYASYVIFDLDQKDYQHAYISGPDTSYLWMLSRSPEASNKEIEHFITTSEALGFDTRKLIFVDQNTPRPSE